MNNKQREIGQTEANSRDFIFIERKDIILGISF